jgi:hypothetical protein
MGTRHDGNETKKYTATRPHDKIFEQERIDVALQSVAVLVNLCVVV